MERKVSKIISPDLPITKLSEDKLNRAAFAQSLAKTISQYSLTSSFTIGLYGEWGSGKTSLVKVGACGHFIGLNGPPHLCSIFRWT